MNKAEMMEAAKTLFTELISGDDPGDIADIMGWDDETFTKVQKTMLAAKADEVRVKPPEHVYVEYMIEQKRNVHDLSSLISNLDHSKQYNALVGAIRLRSDIADKIIDRGFEFGAIKRKDAPGGGHTTIINIGGVAVGDLTSPQLRDAIGTQLNELQSHMTSFGDSKHLLELTPGTLHYGSAAPVAVVDDDGVLVADAEKE